MAVATLTMKVRIRAPLLCALLYWVGLHRLAGMLVVIEK